MKRYVMSYHVISSCHVRHGISCYIMICHATALKGCVSPVYPHHQGILHCFFQTPVLVSVQGVVQEVSEDSHSSITWNSSRGVRGG